MKTIIEALAKMLGEAVQPALGSWNQTARLAFLLIAVAVAATIYARFK